MNLNTEIDVMQAVKTQAQQKRIACALTQAELAARSGVSLGSVKRFERTGEISFRSLLAIAAVVGALEDFESLFKTVSAYARIEDVIAQPTLRKRVRHA